MNIGKANAINPQIRSGLCRIIIEPLLEKYGRRKLRNWTPEPLSPWNRLNPDGPTAPASSFQPLDTKVKKISFVFLGKLNFQDTSGLQSFPPYF
jgi:hypothetical protein